MPGSAMFLSGTSGTAGISFPSVDSEQLLNRSALLTGRRDRGSSQSHLHCNPMLGFTLAQYIRLFLFLSIFFSNL